MTQNNRIWVLMSRCLSGEATPAEAEELRQLLEQAPDKQYLFGVLHAYFTDPGSVPLGRADEDTDLEEKFRRIIVSPDTDTGLAADGAGSTTETVGSPGDGIVVPARGLTLRSVWGYVAAVAVIFCLIWGIYHLIAGRVPHSPTGRSVA
ncbi:MAG TPA: hypothetical protein VGS79_08005, partial [Puia sp.]|nr:hypothetical protein [Puia sp.]